MAQNVCFTFPYSDLDKNLFDRVLQREKAARKQAEQIMEEKARELYEANQKLIELNASLENEVAKRTQELTSAMKRMEVAQNAEKDFLAKMSHEIRTPMNAIIGMTHLMFDTAMDDDQKELINSIHYSASLLKGLITDVLDISKIEAGAVEFNAREFNLRELLVAIQKTFQFNMRSKEVEVLVNYEDSLSEHFLGDDVVVNQILMNLVGNAAKFTEQGFIKIGVKNVQEPNKTGWVEMSVSDTGIGIEHEKLETIFEKFSQAHRDINLQYGGTGLGLSITKHLVGLCQGEIEVESRVGDGTCFTIRLPLKPIVKPQQQDPESLDQSITDGGDVVVLLVEDNPLNQQYAGRLLSKWGIEFDVAESGRIAVECCRKREYSLILMDVQMPEMDGYEATIKIRSQKNDPNASIPIIGLSAFAFEHDVQKALDCGMSDHLTKPYNPSQLKEKLSLYLSEKVVSQAASSDEEASPASDSLEITIQGNDIVLDLEGLEQYYDGDEEYKKFTFQVFLTNIEGYRDQIQQAVDNQDWTEAGNIAHKIKPTFPMVGLQSYQSCVLDLEQEGRSENSNGQIVISHFEALNSLLIKAIPVVKAHMETL